MKESIFLLNLSVLTFNLIPLFILGVKVNLSCPYSYCVFALIILSYYLIQSSVQMDPAKDE